MRARWAPGYDPSDRSPALGTGGCDLGFGSRRAALPAVSQVEDPMPPILARQFARRSLAPALALCLAVVLGACSGSSSPAASGSGSGPSAGTQAAASLPVASGAAACVGAGTTFCGHLKITGGITTETDFVSGVFSKSCADWLKGNKDDATRLTLPIALVLPDINTDTVIQHYKGPGTYDVADLAGNLGGFAVVVGHDQFVAEAKTAGTATLTSDGSGSVKATGMQPAGSANKVQQPIDVVLTWTCFTK